MTIGDRIAELRKNKGYTQVEFAKKTGLSRQIISKYENNECDPRLFNAMCICEVLGISLDYLARGDNV